MAIPYGPLRLEINPKIDFLLPVHNGGSFLVFPFSCMRKRAIYALLMLCDILYLQAISHGGLNKGTMLKLRWHKVTLL